MQDDFEQKETMRLRTSAAAQTTNARSRRFVALGEETDAAFFDCRGRRHELADRLKNDLEFLVVLAQA